MGVMNGINDTEIAVIGSGPGGSLSAALLAEAGREVVILEKGEYLSQLSCESFSITEMIQKYKNGGVSLAIGNPSVSYVEGGCVGGGSEINSGLYHRTPEYLLPHWSQKYGVNDLSYEKLLPFFEENELDLSVSYAPNNCLSMASLKLHEGAQLLGWNSMEVPRWFKYQESNSGVKQSMTETFIPRAIQAGAKLISNTEVINITSMKGGWCLSGWRFLDGNLIPFELKARKIFLCAGAIATPVLLKRNKLSSKAGMQLHMHPTVKIVAKFMEEINDLDMGVPVHQVKEFSPQYSMGCSISTPPYLSLAMMDVEGGGKAIVDSSWRNMAIYYAMTTGGSGTIKTLPFFKDPLVSYNLKQNEIKDLLDGLVDLAKCLFAAGAKEIYPVVKNSRCINSLDEMKAFRYQLETNEINLMSIHLFASCPLGENRQNTVVNSYGALHNYDGIYVNDSSIIPTALGVNPQGTVMALARRNIEHFLGT